MADDALTEAKRHRIQKVQLLSQQMVDTPRYTDITLWDDGDFEVRVYHSFGDGGVGEQIRYRHSTETLAYEKIENIEPRSFEVRIKEPIDWDDIDV